MPPALVILLLDGTFSLTVGWLWSSGRSRVAFWAGNALAALAVLQIGLCTVIPPPSRALKVGLALRRAHSIQMPLQATIYVYWSLYRDEVGKHVPFLLAQLCLAYGLDTIFSW